MCDGEKCFRTKRGDCRSPNRWTAFLQHGIRPSSPRRNGEAWMTWMSQAYRRDEARIKCPHGRARRVADLEDHASAREWMCGHCYAPSDSSQPSVSPPPPLANNGRAGVVELLLTCRPVGKRDMLSRVESEIDAAFLYTDSTQYALPRWLRAGFVFWIASSPPSSESRASQPGATRTPSEALRMGAPHVTTGLSFEAQCDLLGLVCEALVEINFGNTKDVVVPSTKVAASARHAWDRLTETDLHAIGRAAHFFPSHELTAPIVKDVRDKPLRASPSSLYGIVSVRVHKNALETKLEGGDLLRLSNSAVTAACGSSFRTFGAPTRGAQGEHLSNYRTQMVRKLNSVPPGARWVFLERVPRSEGGGINFCFMCQK